VKKSSMLYFFCLILLLYGSTWLYSSDRTDAIELMNKCDTEVKALEIPLKNFGDKDDLAKFDAGLSIIKQGRVKLAQSKFIEAKAKFEEYLKFQYDIYGSIAVKYVERTQQVIDKIAEELAEYLNQEDVLKNFNTASQYLESAKLYLTKKQYQNVIPPCRIAKNNVISLYTFLKIKVPEEYQKDQVDINNKIL
jgi:hypothetical protein